MAMICRVCNYIKYGWDIYLVDPDGGANVQNKLQVAQLNKNPEDVTLLRTIPDIKDSLWTKEIYKAPSVTFGTIYQFLVERKVLIKKANHLESVIDRRDGSDLGVHVQGNVNLSPGISESVSYSHVGQSLLLFSGWPCSEGSIPSNAKSPRVCLHRSISTTINEEEQNVQCTCSIV